MTKLIRSSILAGIAIGFAGFGFLASGVQSEAYGPVVGAILFCFGLLTVVGYKLSLYTGTAGFIRKGEVGMLCVVLLGNIFGCLCAAMLSRVSPMDIQGAAQNILELRLKTGAWRCGLLGIGCCGSYAAQHDWLSYTPVHLRFCRKQDKQLQCRLYTGKIYRR